MLTMATVIATATAGCDSAPTEPSPPLAAEWRVSGTVRDSRMSSLRIAGARVAVTPSGHTEEYSAETDAQGRYRIRVPEGSAVLAIDAGPTYVGWRDSLSVANDTVLPDAAMRHTGRPPWPYVFSAAGMQTLSGPTALERLEHAGIQRRWQQHWIDILQPSTWQEIESDIYEAAYDLPGDADPVIEFIVPTAYGDTARARMWASHFGSMLGQMPADMIRGVADIVLNPSSPANYGGNCRMIFDIGIPDAHHGTMLHELGHAVMEPLRRGFSRHEGCQRAHGQRTPYPHHRAETAPAWWVYAVAVDGVAISGYGGANAAEDWAETVVAWLSVRYRRAEVTPNDLAAIETTIPHRLKYLDEMVEELGIDMWPYEPSPRSEHSVTVIPRSPIP